MSVAIETILGGKNLTGVIQSVPSGVPADILPPSFLTPTRRVSGNQCTYLKVSGTRQTAKLAQYGSPSKARALQGVSEQSAKLIHSFEHQLCEPETLLMLKDPNTDVQDKGMWEISRQSKEFKAFFTNLRISAVYSALAKQCIYFDIHGNLLPSSSTAATTIDFGTPAGNKDAIGGIIAAKWSTAGTDIIGQMKALKAYARKLTGYPLTTAFYGSGVPGYISGNTALANLIKNNAAFSVPMSAGEIPSGLLGIKNWIPFNEAFFADKDGTNQDWIAVDDIVFTPDPSPEWYEMVEGSYLVPNSMNITADGVAAMGNLTEKNGMFSYATLETDPVTIKQLAGDTFLPLIKVPSAIFRAGVDL